MSDLSISSGLSVGYGLSASTALSRGTGLYFGGFNAAFSPASLFAAGEPGAWYDPSDMTTLFQDSAGTTPVTAVEQPVGLMLDKSKGLALGPELVTNGDFSNGVTGWAGFNAATAISDELSTLRQQTLSGGSAGAKPNTGFTTIVGRTYKLSYDVVEVGAGVTNVKAYVGTASGSTVNGVSGIARNTPGTVTAYFVAALTTYYLTTEHIGTSGTFSRFDNISVKELTGNHAFQSTSASRPVFSARYNLLTKTEEFNDAAWTKANSTVTPNSTVAPDGASTADKIVENLTTNKHQLYASLFATSGQIFTIYVKAAERFIFGVYSGAFFSFNLSTVVATGAGASITSVGNGWYRCVVPVSATTQVFFGPAIQTVTSDATWSYTGDGTSGIYIWGADLRVANDGVGLPVYQRVNTATDYVTTGFPPYLKFDGVDDGMVTNTITPGVDKAQVFAGVRKFTTSNSRIVELSNLPDSNAGSFWLSAPQNTYEAFSRGSATIAADQLATAIGFVSPISNVLASTHDIAADRTTISVNGIVAATATGDQGTGNFLAYPLYVGRRGGTTLPFNGRLFPLIVRFGPTLTAAQITNTETWVNGKTGAY